MSIHTEGYLLLDWLSIQNNHSPVFDQGTQHCRCVVDLMFLFVPKSSPGGENDLFVRIHRFKQDRRSLVRRAGAIVGLLVLELATTVSQLKERKTLVWSGLNVVCAKLRANSSCRHQLQLPFLLAFGLNSSYRLCIRRNLILLDSPIPPPQALAPLALWHTERFTGSGTSTLHSSRNYKCRTQEKPLG